MYSRIIPLLGLLPCLAIHGLQAQVPRPTYQRPTYQKPSFPTTSQPTYSPSNAQSVQNPAPQPETFRTNSITAESMELLDNTRKLGVGDRLSFRVVQEREEARPLAVTDVGEVEFPLIGRVKAANKTLKQLAYEVKQLLDREYYYNSTVLIGLDATSRFRGRIYVIGAVGGVGPQDIPPDEVFTVSKAILRAGGFGDFANQRKVKLIRKGAPGAESAGTKKDEVIVDCKAIYDGDSNAVDPVLQPDDMIVVPQRLINF